MAKEIFKYLAPTPWGIFTLAASKKGLKAISFPKKRVRRVSKKQSQRIGNMPASAQRIFLQMERWLKSYLTGKSHSIPHFPIDCSARTMMQAKMLKGLSQIPWGETRSYEWLAKACGIPKGLQATGQLLKSNPLPILFPCHRIIRKDGSLGGFSQGATWKKKLLTHESR